MLTLDTFSQPILSFMLIFGRLGAAISVTTGFGEKFISARVRLGFALAITYVLFPVVMPQLPDLTAPNGFLSLFFMELMVGFTLGAVIKCITLALGTAGSLISMQSGLSAGAFYTPLFDSESVYSAFFITLGLALFFILDLHHLFLTGLAASYTTLPPGKFTFLKDLPFLLRDFLTTGFMLGLSIAAPLIVIQLVFIVSLGLANRLMPNLQLYFISQPLQLFLGLLSVALSISAIFMLYTQTLGNKMNLLFGGF